MDSQSREALLRLINDQRVASLGTLYRGAPLVSLVLFSVGPGSSGFDIHVSRLAQHTQGLLESGRVGLMIAEPDRDARNPQTLARLSIQGDAEPLLEDHPGYESARESYQTKYPTAALNFQLADFSLFRIIPRTARLVTGFGKIFDLTQEDFEMK